MNGEQRNFGEEDSEKTLQGNAGVDAQGSETRFVAEGGVEVTDELLDEWAEPWEKGELSGKAAGFVAGPGRPRLCDEPTKVVSIRLPVSVIKASEEKAKRYGQTRSQRMREAIIADAMEE